MRRQGSRRIRKPSHAQQRPRKRSLHDQGSDQHICHSTSQHKPRTLLFDDLVSILDLRTIRRLSIRDDQTLPQFPVQRKPLVRFDGLQLQEHQQAQDLVLTLILMHRQLKRLEMKM